METREIHPCCLTIAGSDSGGNAGVQADLRAFHAYGVHGCTVFSALTAQNPFGVSAIHGVPADFVAAQLEAVLGTYAIRGLKTGMIADPGVIEVIADRLSAHPGIVQVIDPVMIATSGARLIPDAAVKELERRLFPRATVITPNLPEAEEICGLGGRPTARRVEDARELARRIHERFGCAVLVKGGHGERQQADGPVSVDVLCHSEGKNTEIEEFSDSWITDPVSTHGTGCSLAAALAAGLALGKGLSGAVAAAKRYVHSAIANSYLVGEKCGVLGFVSQTDFLL